jgi:uncharacterized protein
MGWIGMLVLVCTSGRFIRLRESLGAVGRTAFSNYILQTLIATTVFYGLGLFGSVNRVGQIVFCAAVWALQLVLAPAWLKRYDYGPLEWLWRSLTYWRKMPLRRSRQLATAGA